MDIRTILGEWLSSHGYKGLRQPNGSCNCLVEGHLMCRSEDVCLIDDDRACVADNRDEEAKQCEQCCYWGQKDLSFSANYIIGECTKDADNNYTTEGIRLSAIGYKFTTRTFSCSDFTKAHAKACDGNDGCPRCAAAYKSSIRKCLKLAELEKRLVFTESLIMVNRLAYDRHIQQHNGETVT